METIIYIYINKYIYIYFYIYIYICIQQHRKKKLIQFLQYTIHKSNIKLTAFFLKSKTILTTSNKMQRSYFNPM